MPSHWGYPSQGAHSDSADSTQALPLPGLPLRMTQEPPKHLPGPLGCCFGGLLNCEAMSMLAVRPCLSSPLFQYGGRCRDCWV